MGGDLTNNCPLQLLMTYQSARNTQKIPCIGRRPGVEQVT